MPHCFLGSISSSLALRSFIYSISSPSSSDSSSLLNSQGKQVVGMRRRFPSNSPHICSSNGGSCPYLRNLRSFPLVSYKSNVERTELFSPIPLVYLKFPLSHRKIPYLLPRQHLFLSFPKVIHTSAFTVPIALRRGSVFQIRKEKKQSLRQT